MGVDRLEVRLLYAFSPDRRIVVLHGFLKKTRTLPARDERLARTRWRELQES